MKWLEPNIKDIHTTDIIYYSSLHNDTCDKICATLDIDLFPDLSQSKYWYKTSTGWSYENIKESQKVNVDDKIFDIRLGKMIEKSRSYILFTYCNNDFQGLFHFTDYDNPIVYQSLYNNYYHFESTLRTYLDYLGFNHNDIENYYKKKSGEKKNREYYERRFREITSERFRKESNKYGKFQTYELRDLLRFVVSLSKSSEGQKITGVPKGSIKAEDIADLRNTIMHSKDFTGRTPEILHNIENFIKFFERVQHFKYTYRLILNEFKIIKLKNMQKGDIIKYFYRDKQYKY